MDVYCPKCGEPCDMDYFHDVADEKGSTYTAVMRDFQQRGCVAVDFGFCVPNEEGATRAMYADALYDLLGDDMDGAASMLADYF